MSTNNKLKKLIKKSIKEQLIDPLANTEPLFTPSGLGTGGPPGGTDEWEPINDAVWRVISITPSAQNEDNITDYEGAVCYRGNRKKSKFKRTNSRAPKNYTR
jgi:hypothetical protein